MQGYSVRDIEQFLDWCVEKGLLKHNTGISRKTAVSKILGTLDPDEQSDIRSIDMSLAFHRWQNKEGATYSPDSLAVYERRAKIAVREFLRFKEDPKSYKPQGQTRRSSAGSAGPKKAPRKGGTPEAAAESEDESHGISVDSTAAPPLMMSLPIRPGVAAWIRISGLPRDMTAVEARSAAALAKVMIEPLLTAAAHERAQ